MFKLQKNSLLVFWSLSQHLIGWSFFFKIVNSHDFSLRFSFILPLRTTKALCICLSKNFLFCFYVVPRSFDEASKGGIAPWFHLFLLAFFILPLGNKSFIQSHVTNKIFWKFQGYLWKKPNDSYDPSLGFQWMGSSTKLNWDYSSLDWSM